MSDGAFSLFTSLNNYTDLQDLIDNGEAEGLHLECKAPGAPKLTQALKAQLAKAVSGFSNTDGGVIIWGISTTPHAHSGHDILTQLEPIGRCQYFSQRVEKAIPSLATPAVAGTKVKSIKEQPKDTKGIVLAYIPRFDGDPVQSNEDHLFYFRCGDAFQIAPYSMIKRLFAASESPDIYPLIPDALVALQEDEFWDIPVAIENRSSAIGEHILVSVRVVNPSTCESIRPKHFKDLSALNPGLTLYQVRMTGVAYRGMNTVVGNLHVKMKVNKRPTRTLSLQVTVYANKMRARAVKFRLHLAKSKITVMEEGVQFLY